MFKKFLLGLAALALMACATVTAEDGHIDTRWVDHQTTIAHYYITKTTEDCHRCTFPMPQNEDVPLVKRWEEMDEMYNIRIMWFEESAPLFAIHMVCPDGVDCVAPERCVVVEFADWDAMGDFVNCIGDPNTQIVSVYMMGCDGFLQNLKDQLRWSEEDHNGLNPAYR